MMKKHKNMPGARFARRGKTFFRPTAMSVAMADAGIIPAPHIVQDTANECLLRQRNDTYNIRLSRRIQF